MRRQTEHATSRIAVQRKGYLDWLRGVGVLVMIQGHVIDSWTAGTDRDRTAYHVITFVGGIGGAPLFLFLAGIAMVLAAGARLRHGRCEPETASLARRRGWQIFGLAFLFRLQSWIISGGSLATLLKVDILNVMGLSLVGAGALWSIRYRWRATLFMATAAAVAMVTPIVRSSELLALLPDPIERYVRPLGATTAFALFPWAGFLLAGCAVGLQLDTKSPAQERRMILTLMASGGVLALAGYAASFLPAIYAQTDFWTSSPTFFFIRLGFLMMLVGVAYLVSLVWKDRRLLDLGRSSLFVYWIHVEMAYGILSAPLHRRLPLEQAYVAFVLFAFLLYGLVRVKERMGTTKITMGDPSWSQNASM